MPKITIWDKREQKVLGELNSPYVPTLGERLTLVPERPNGHTVRDIKPTANFETGDWEVRLEVD